MHIAFIMDGNRRYAKDLGKPAFEGHRAGYEKLKQVGDWCLEKGIQYLTVFGFSTENWKRAPEEVDFLMKLFEKAVTEELQEFHKKGIRLRRIGRAQGLPQSLLKAFAHAEQITAQNTRATLMIALNYGGRADITDAVQSIVAQGIPASDITETLIAQHLGTKEIPDPDLIVRTSGEQRLSGFLPWESVYAELLFLPVHWPALTREHFDQILKDFSERNRRFGK